MKPWEEIKEKFSYWPHPMWQWATTDSKCVNCDIYGHETPQEFLVYVEGEGDKQYCKMCYFSKFVEADDYDEDDYWEYSFDEEDALLWMDTDELQIEKIQSTLEDWSN